jgi:dTMP kinase
MKRTKKSEQPSATNVARSNGKVVKRAKSVLPAELPSRFCGTPLPGVNESELHGTLIVLEGTDGSGRSTQIALLTEWLESEGFAVQTMGLRRSSLVSKDIDVLLAENVVTRLTLALMYATDFYDQLEHRILPALRSGMVVLADRYFFTLVARAAVRGLDEDYLHGIYEMAMRPDLTFWLNVRPEVAFDREFKKSHSISYWEAGRDMSLSNDLFQSFIRYQSMVKKEFERLSRIHNFVELDGNNTVSVVNKELRKQIGALLGIRGTRYTPSHSLAHLWR